MGKKGSGSWLTAVKRAFRSPTKDGTATITTIHQNCRTQLEDNQPATALDQHYNRKKREKRRWLFRKPTVLTTTSDVITTVVHHGEGTVKEAANYYGCVASHLGVVGACVPPDQDKHAVSVADHASAAIIGLTSSRLCSSVVPVKHHFAAIVIQTAFRGYLARRALRGLKGIVTLQALIRAQNVRKQATITLRCMQALLRVQARLNDQRSRLSHDGARKSIFTHTAANFSDSKHLQEIRHRKSVSREGSCIAEDWNEMPRTLEELDALLHSRKEAALTRENSLASAFSQQIWKSGVNMYPSRDEKEIEERANWLDRWMTAKQWECQRGSRASFERRESIKTVEVDRSRPYSTKSVNQAYMGNMAVNSPRQRATKYTQPNIQQPPVTPSPSKISETKLPLQVRSASPRCLKEERISSSQRLLTPRFNRGMCRYSTCANDVAMPNYMAATESAKARVRSQSAPRQRPSTPDHERERPGSAKKRLAYPSAVAVPDPEPCECDSDYRASSNNNYSSFNHNSRSPSFKSVQVGHVGMGQHYYTDSTGGEISPCSTTDLRRWLR